MSQTPSSLITLSDPRSPAAEAYRTLRTNIYFSSLERSIHTLLVTTVAPDEGKSITLANLAVSLAQGDKKTILVDADLRRPTLHTIFGLEQRQRLDVALHRRQRADRAGAERRGRAQSASADQRAAAAQSGRIARLAAHAGRDRSAEGARRHRVVRCAARHRRDRCLGVGHARRRRAAGRSIRRRPGASTPNAPSSNWRNSTSASSARCLSARRWTMRWADIRHEQSQKPSTASSPGSKTA